MIWILLIVSLAAICNAVMDILENENFHSSRFAKLNQSFWYKRESWVNKYEKIEIKIPIIWYRKNGKK